MDHPYGPLSKGSEQPLVILEDSIASQSWIVREEQNRTSHDHSTGDLHEVPNHVKLN